MKFFRACFYLFIACCPVFSSLCYGEDVSGVVVADKQGGAILSSFTEAEVSVEIEDLQGRIKALQGAEKENKDGDLGASLSPFKEQIEKAQETLAFYNRQILALKKAEILADEKKVLEESVVMGTAFQLPQSPPYSLQMYDDALTRLDESLRSKDAAQMSLALTKKMLKDARQHLKEREQQLREMRAEAATGKGTGEHGALSSKIGIGLAEVEYGRAVLRYEDLAYKNAEIKLEISAIRVSVAQNKVNHLRTNLHFDAEDLQKQLAGLDEQKAEIQKASDGLLAKLQRTEILLVRSKKKLEKLSGEGDEYIRTKAEAGALEAWRHSCQRGVEQYEGSQQLLNYQKDVWEQRYALIRGSASSADVKMWQKTANSQRERMQQALILEQNEQGSLHLQISQLEKQLTQDSLSPVLHGLVKNQLEALKKMDERTFAYLVLQNVTSRMASRFAEEASAELAENIFAEKMAVLAARVQAVWKFELLIVDDQSVTVGKVGMALLLLVFGIILAGYFTRSLQKHFLVRTKLSESASAITEKLLYYLTLCIVVLVSMRVVSIPLTAFAFLGGAMAIGVGFGGQKIISNFISGFILMVEQPVKVGDLIQMADIVGKIEEIGARSTRVRTFANIHVLVPNSYFLENNIINWTHSDKIIRGEVNVGVVYGSPTKEVQNLLLQAAHKHKEALNSPAAYVFFNDFGDNALAFTLYFWIAVQLINDKKRIESEMRFLIEDIFREAGIIVAFPQRDVHLDTSSPLKFEMVSPAEHKVLNQGE